MPVGIAGFGRYVPEKRLTNQDLEKLVDTSDEWIVQRTGIRERRIAAPDQVTSTLALNAARAALEDAKMSPEELDLVICATVTGDQSFPATACRIGFDLGAKNAGGFDLGAACSGFVFGSQVAAGFISSGQFKNVLVVGAEILSRILDYSDRNTCVLFGDGAGAVVLSRDEEPGILSTHLHADGRYESLLYVDGGTPIGQGRIAEGNAYTRMQGNEVFKVAVRTLRGLVEETLAANAMSESDIDWLIPHQANFRIIEATARKLNLPWERVVVTVAEHGNTSAASVPLALDTAVRDGRIQRGQNLLLEAFGGGFTWGSAMVRF
ncbi:MAG: ketoacyl-ACP synthase III [Planctomycetes bacterium]|nr:ketoacyl-ACP synthase III [Planctomycetota bacterium]